MNHRVSTPIELRSAIRSLRKSRGLSQTQLGTLLGISQKRVADIEGAPERTSFDQITRLILALGGRLVVEVPDASETKPTKAGKRAETSNW